MPARPPTIRQAPRLDSRPSAVPAAMPMVPERPVVAQPPMLLSALDRSRSAMWPLALAFVVGLGLGIPFGFGLYPVMSQQRPPENASAQPSPSAGTSPRPAGRTTAPAAQPVAPATQSLATPAQTAAPAAAPPPVNEPAPPAPASTQGRAVPQAGRAAAPPAPAPAAPANSGRMLIRTTPAGARVFVDGRDHGASPAEVRGLTVGIHTVRVVRAGYADEERSVAVTAERPAQNLTIALTRAAAAPPAAPADRAPQVTAARSEPLRIESRPAGAQVFLDGRLIGTTPLVVSDVALGGHQVRLQLEGYRPWAVSTDVIAGGDNHVTASLER